MAKEYFPIVADALAKTLQVPLETIRENDGLEEIGVHYGNFLEALYYLAHDHHVPQPAPQKRNDRFRIWYEEKMRSVSDLCDHVANAMRALADKVASNSKVPAC